MSSKRLLLSSRYPGYFLRAALLATVLGAGAGCVQLTPEFIRGTEYQRAVLLYEQGKLADAREAAMRVDPGEPDGPVAARLVKRIDFLMNKASRRHEELAEEYERSGVWRLALREYKAALSFDPGSGRLEKKVKTIEEGLLSGELAGVDEVIAAEAARSEERKKAQKKAPSRGAGQAESKSDRKSTAEDKASRQEEAAADEHYMRGKLFMEAGAFNRAIEEFEEVVKTIPFYMDTVELLGQARRARDEAIDLHLKRGIAYFQKEELELAIKEWNSVLGLDPENTTAADYKSRAELILERLKKIRRRQGR